MLDDTQGMTYGLRLGENFSIFDPGIEVEGLGLGLGLFDLS